MRKDEFRTPLIQSGALLVAIVFIISLIPSGDGMSVGSVIGAIFTGIFKLILFILALALGVALAIATLFGIFIGAVALQSPQRASEIYAETKIRLSTLIQNALACRSEASSWNLPSSKIADTAISQEEYVQMKDRISSLQNANLQLQGDVSSLHSKNAQLQDDLHGLTRMVDELKESEQKIKDLISELSVKIKEEPDVELKNQIQKLEVMVSQTNQSIADLAGRLESLESSSMALSPETQSGGIFSYIENEQHRALLSAKVQEGITRDLTYAQFDEFLTGALPAELDKVIKDHPSLTKDYIRSLRK